MAKGKTTYKIHSLTLNDSLNLAGILAGGGLAGQAQKALSLMEQQGTGAGLEAVGALVMGALANPGTREEMRSFLFTVWKTTEDEQATEKDLDIDGRLKAVYADNGELDKDTPYFKKLAKFHRLPMTGLSGIVRALYNSGEMRDFLQSLREFLPNTSTGESTGSNGSTTLESVK